MSDNESESGAKEEGPVLGVSFKSLSWIFFYKKLFFYKKNLFIKTIDLYRRS